MSRSVRLRPWQKAALERFQAAGAAGAADFLAVATPGAGKTTFALVAARQALADHPARVVVVTPTQHLKHQWADAAAALDLHLEPEWSAADGRLPADVHGLVTTYQQVATSAAALRAVANRAFVVFDEIHHAGDERAWGDSVRAAFEPAGRRLSLSGTPFRSDTQAIPFVRYELEEARPDFEYGYGDALRDGRVVRPVAFPRINGEMEWTSADGALHAHTFDDALDRVRSGQRLRTALSLEGEWLPAVLVRAHRQLLEVRRDDPSAGGLVIATDQDHARGIAEILRRRVGTHAAVVTSDDPTASSRISRFARSDDPWIVAVRMVSEGVDIPRLRVGVFATTTTTELFFRQAVGRLVRWTPGGRRQQAFMFIPDDPRLRARAVQIAEQVRHSLRRETVDRDARLDELDPLQDAGDQEQLSLFAAISAVATDETHAKVPWSGSGTLGWSEAADDDDDSGAADEAFTITLAPLAGAGGAAEGDGAGAPGVNLRERKRRLRDANAERARTLARLTGLTHAQVNAELNRLTGLQRVSEATLDQLALRLHHAEKWLARV